jgi:hypothetical protein
MSKTTPMIALAVCCACASPDPTVVGPAEQPPDAALQADPGAFASLAELTRPAGDPPAGWVNDPAELGPDFPQRASNCDLVTFPFPAAVQPYVHPAAACRQREWGHSGIVRQQGRDLHVTTLRVCDGAPGDITEIRLCNLEWKSRPTTWGMAGPSGCVAIEVSPTCGV